MTLPRIFLDQPLHSGTSITIDGNPFRHLATVLRLKPPAPVILFNGQGGEFHGIIDHLERRRLRIRLDSFHDGCPESSLKITLAQGISRGQRMDYTLQKAVELGVTDIVPLHSRRCQGETGDKRYQHWLGVIHSACEQSGRTRLPTLASPRSLNDWLNNAPLKNHQGLFLDTQGCNPTLRQLPKPDKPLVIMAGPEGGFSPEEQSAIVAGGFQSLSLGPRILRTETAGVAAIAACQALWGDMG